MGFKAKGYAESYKVPPLEISEEVDGVRTVGAIGMIWIPEKDVLKFRPPSLDFTGRKHRGKLVSPILFSGTTFQELDQFVPRDMTLRTVASKAAEFWDPPGLAEAWYLGVKHVLRLSTEAVARTWDKPLPPQLRDLWVEKFWEMIQLSKVEFPRCTFPLGINYTELTIVALSDMGLIGKLQCFYSLKKISEENYHVQLIYSKSQLNDKRTVPCQELDSLSCSSTLLDKICISLGNVDRRALLMDSTICAYWLMKDPIKLGVFQRKRVQNVLRHCGQDDIFHIRSCWNSSDVGTKRPEPMSCVIPGSYFSRGPKILQLGLKICEEKSYIKRISNVILDPAIKNAAFDGFAHKDMPKEYFDIDVNRISSNNHGKKVKETVTANTSTIQGHHTGDDEIDSLPNILEQETEFNISKAPSNHQNDQDPEHAIMANNIVFVKKVSERLKFHEYLVNPIKRPWSVSVRTLSIVFHFIRQTLLKRLAATDSSYSKTWKRIYRNLYETEYEPILQECFTNLCFLAEDNDDSQSAEANPYDFVNAFVDVQTNIDPIFDLGTYTQPLKYANVFPDIQCMKLAKESAIVYYLKLASSELRQFYSKTMLRKHAFLMNGIYYSKQRLLEVDNITNLMGDEITTHELGIHNRLPCSDRYSPVAISILMHFHRKISNHQGVDRTWTSTLSSIYIFQGQPMLKEIIRSCFHCRHKLMKKFKTSYGPINKLSLTFAPVNRHVMLDLSGPYLLRSKLHARITRNNPNSTKVYLLHTVCLTSFLNSIAIVEDYGSEAFTDALHRIGSRYGYPSLAWTDASRAQLKSLLGTELTMSSFLGTIYKETGIEVRISGSGSQSHSRQGRIEKAIHCFQMFIENKRSHIESLTVLQFDSLISQASAFLNSMPLCHKKRVGASISSNLVSPFSFLLGRRSNSRAPAGYPQLPTSRGDILDGVAKASEGMLNYFTAAIPDLLLKPDNYDESEKMIMEGDIVLFPYEDNAISRTYKLGLVTDLELDSDQKPRIVELAYANSQEQSLPTNHKDKIKLKTCCRFTRKGVHTLVKVYSVTDPDINKDIDHINAQLKGDNDLESHPIDASNESDNFEPLNKDNNPLVPDVTFSLIMAQMGYLVRKQ